MAVPAASVSPRCPTTRPAVCIPSGPNLPAVRTSCQGCAGFGARQHNLPTGGSVGGALKADDVPCHHTANRACIGLDERRIGCRGLSINRARPEAENKARDRENGYCVHRSPPDFVLLRVVGEGGEQKLAGTSRLSPSVEKSMIAHGLSQQQKAGRRSSPTASLNLCFPPRGENSSRGSQMAGMGQRPTCKRSFVNDRSRCGS
jgi:hypothetical protein